MSIHVITHQDIERRGLIGMEDYLRSIPGVNQIDNGSINNAIVIRGLTLSPEFENFTSGTTVGSYFGETPITGAGGVLAGGIDVRPVDIERIEVLRGPQGTAYGSASLGGTMRIIPAKPELDGFGAKVAAAYSGTSRAGDDNSMIQGVVNIPIVADKFGLRAVGYRYDESGFYRNIASIDPATIALAETFGLGDQVRALAQDDIGQVVSTGGRLAAFWQATDKLNLSMNVLTQKIEQDGQPYATHGKYGQARLPIAPQARIRGEEVDASDTHMDLVNLVLNYDLGWSELTSAVSRIDSGSDYALDITRLFGGLPVSVTQHSDFEAFTAEVRLASQLEGRFQFLGGLFYEDVEQPGVQTVDWSAPVPNIFGTDPAALFVFTNKREQRAAFGEVSYDLTDKLTATVGGRYVEYDEHNKGLTEGGLYGIPLGTGIFGILEGRASDSTFKAHLSYEPTQDSMFYASWADGFRLGHPAGDDAFLRSICDTNADGLVDDTDLTIESILGVDSDFVDNYEIGGKVALFDRRMTIDGAAYHIEWHDMPVRITPSVGGSCGFIANAGSATSDGVELQTSLLVGGGLRLDVGIGYTKAELAQDRTDLPGSPRKGARLPGSPEVSANFSAQYDFQVAGYKAFVRADSFYAGELYSDLLETPSKRAGDYIKVDARVGAEIKNVSVEFFVRNLTNEDAFTWRSPGQLGDFRMRPRTVGIQLGYDFK